MASVLLGILLLNDNFLIGVRFLMITITPFLFKSYAMNVEMRVLDECDFC